MAATIAPTVTRLDTGLDVLLILWTGFATGDTCTPVTIGDYSDLTVTIEGTFGSGTVVLQGSNDGTNYYTLTDPQGNAISKTSAGIKAVTETPRFIRPSTSGGSADAVQVRILARRGSR